LTKESYYTDLNSEELAEYLFSLKYEELKSVLKELSEQSNPQYKDVFLNMLKAEPGASVKQSLIIALGRIKNDETISSQLIELYNQETNEKLRKSILIALGRNENKIDEVNKIFLFTIENDTYAKNRSIAIKYLIRIFEDESVESLIYYHSIETEQEIKDQIIEKIKEYALRFSLDFESDIELFDKVSNHIEYSNIVKILTNFVDFETDTIINALNAFSNINRKEDIDLVTSLLEKTTNIKIKNSCYKIVERLGDSNLIESLFIDFENESLNKDVRLAIVDAMISIWDNRYPSKVIEILNNETNGKVRGRLFDLLSTITGYTQEILPIIKEISHTDKSKKIRSKAAKLYNQLNKPFVVQELKISDDKTEMKDIFRMIDDDQASVTEFDLITPELITLEQEVVTKTWDEQLTDDIPSKVQEIAKKASLGKTNLLSNELDLLIQHGYLEKQGKILDILSEEYYIRDKSINEAIMEVLSTSTASIVDLSYRLKLTTATIIKRLRSISSFSFTDKSDNYTNIFTVKKELLNEEIHYTAQDIPYEARFSDPLLIMSLLCFDSDDLNESLVYIKNPTITQINSVAKNLSIFWDHEDIINDIKQNKEIQLVNTTFGLLPILNDNEIIQEIRDKILDSIFDKKNNEERIAENRLNNLLEKIYTVEDLTLQEILKWNIMFGQICNVYRKFDLDSQKLTSIRNVILHTILNDLSRNDRIRLLKQDEIYDIKKISISKHLITDRHTQLHNDLEVIVNDFLKKNEFVDIKKLDKEIPHSIPFECKHSNNSILLLLNYTNENVGVFNLETISHIKQKKLTTNYRFAIIINKYITLDILNDQMENNTFHLDNGNLLVISEKRNEIFTNSDESFIKNLLTKIVTHQIHRPKDHVKNFKRLILKSSKNYIKNKLMDLDKEAYNDFRDVILLEFDYFISLTNVPGYYYVLKPLVFDIIASLVLNQVLTKMHYTGKNRINFEVSETYIELNEMIKEHKLNPIIKLLQNTLSLFKLNKITNQEIFDIFYAVLDDSTKQMLKIKDPIIDTENIAISPFQISESISKFLVKLCLRTYDESVLSLNCGSGNILYNAYKEKLQLLDEYGSTEIFESENEMKKTLMSELTGVDVFSLNSFLTKHRLFSLINNNPISEINVMDYNFLDLANDDSLSVLNEGSGFVISEDSKYNLESSDIAFISYPMLDSTKFKRDDLKAFLGNKRLSIITESLDINQIFIAAANYLVKPEGRFILIVPMQFISDRKSANILNYLFTTYSAKYIIRTNDDFVYINKLKPGKIVYIILEKRTPKNSDSTVIVKIRKKITKMNSNEITHLINKIQNMLDDTYHDPLIDALKINIMKYIGDRFSFIKLLDSTGRTYKGHMANFLEKIPNLIKLKDLYYSIETGWDPVPFEILENIVVYNANLIDYLDETNLFIDQEDNEKIIAKNKSESNNFAIEKSNLVFGLHKTHGIRKLTIDDYTCFIVLHGYEKHDAIYKNPRYDAKSLDLKYIRDKANQFKKTKVYLIDTIDFISRDFYHIGFYSNSNLLATRENLYFYDYNSIPEAKAHVLFFNSVIMHLQLLSHRYDKNIIKLYNNDLIDGVFKQFDLEKLSYNEINKLAEIYDEIENENFPCFYDQYNQRDSNRIKIDTAILDVLGFEESKMPSILEELYVIILNELSIMELNDEDEEDD